MKNIQSNKQMRKKGLANKDSGFKVPENYFQNFETRMFDKIQTLPQENELHKIQQPFNIPDNYFEVFEKKMLHKLAQEPDKPRVISLFSRKTLSYVAGIAAVIAVILTSSVIGHGEKTTFEDLDMLAVENYLFETLDLSNPEETQLIDKREFSFAQGIDSNIDHEAVLEYLNENFEEPSLLLNEE